MSTHRRPSLRQNKTHLTSKTSNFTKPQNQIHSLVVFKLLQGENVFVKIFLQLLVCIVDVELLEAVHLRGGGNQASVKNRTGIKL